MKYLIWSVGALGFFAGSAQDHAGNTMPGMAIAGGTLILAYTMHSCTNRIIARLKSGGADE